MATEAARHSFLGEAQRDAALERIAAFSAPLVPPPPVIRL
jgi:adenosine deaminase